MSSSVSQPSYGPQRFRKRPVEIEALQFNGTDARTDDLVQWCTRPAKGFKGAIVDLFVPLWWDDADDILGPELYERLMSAHAAASLYVDANSSWLPITVGEWIAKDRHGFYPIKNDVFVESYEQVLA